MSPESPAPDSPPDVHPQESQSSERNLAEKIFGRPSGISILLIASGLLTTGLCLHEMLTNPSQSDNKTEKKDEALKDLKFAVNIYRTAIGRILPDASDTDVLATDRAAFYTNSAYSRMRSDLSQEERLLWDELLKTLNEAAIQKIRSVAVQTPTTEHSLSCISARNDDLLLTFANDVPMGASHETSVNTLLELTWQYGKAVEGCLNMRDEEAAKTLNFGSEMTNSEFLLTNDLSRDQQWILGNILAVQNDRALGAIHMVEPQSSKTGNINDEIVDRNILTHLKAKGEEEIISQFIAYELLRNGGDSATLTVTEEVLKRYENASSKPKH